MPNDFELLRDYVERGSEEAFHTLVERHSGMVLGAASRILGDIHLAEEVTQAVFVLLARKGGQLRRGTVVAGWLHRTARFVALEAVRARRRRAENQKQLAIMNALNDSHSLESPESAWERIAPFLEEVIGRLGRKDQEALILRFLEEKSFADVGIALGASEAAAKMRVGRALDKLRATLHSRGVTISAGVLAAALSAHGATAAPVGLSGGLAGSVLASSGAAGSAAAEPALVGAALKTMAWQKIKSGLVAGALSLLMAGGFLFWVSSLKQNAPSLRTITGFQRMAGNWEGTYESRGSDGSLLARMAATLKVTVSPEGRSCDIEMRLTNPAEPTGQPRVFQFTHALNSSGDRITTVDDPQIGRVAGEGVVTESRDEGPSGEWRAGYRIIQANLAGTTDCHWAIKGDELKIMRHDETGNGNRLDTEMKLRRRIDREDR